MIVIRRYRREDARQVAALISDTYDQFNRREGTAQAVRDYIASYAPAGQTTADLHARFARSPQCLVAVSGARIVGVLRGRDNRLINLFVADDQHRRGLATRLFARFEARCRQAGCQSLVLRSSLYGVPFYLSVGCQKTTGVRRFHGLLVQPMRKWLDRI